MEQLAVNQFRACGGSVLLDERENFKSTMEKMFDKCQSLDVKAPNRHERL